jgi:hypothetical protein
MVLSNLYCQRQAKAKAKAMPERLYIQTIIKINNADELALKLISLRFTASVESY